LRHHRDTTATVTHSVCLDNARRSGRAGSSRAITCGIAQTDHPGARGGGQRAAVVNNAFVCARNQPESDIDVAPQRLGASPLKSQLDGFGGVAHTRVAQPVRHRRHGSRQQQRHDRHCDGHFDHAETPLLARHFHQHSLPVTSQQALVDDAPLKLLVPLTPPLVSVKVCPTAAPVVPVAVKV